MSSIPIVLDTYFLAQVEDASKWEDRFDLLVTELGQEYGTSFMWVNGNDNTEIDIVFVLYPPVHHQRMVADRVLEGYVTARSGYIANIHVIVIGPNSRNAKVGASDVVDIVNEQCIPCGVKGAGFRVLRPEELDDDIRKTLVRLHTRRTGCPPLLAEDLPFTDSSTVTKSGFPYRPAYESSDL